MEKKNYNSGFTLIEMVIYLALFSIVIGGGLVATYNIVEGTNADTNHVILQEEANFLLRKINWALTGATSINAPANFSDTTLIIVKIIDGTSTQITFSLNSGNLTTIRVPGAGSPVQLNESSFKVSLTPSYHLFTHTSASGTSDKMEVRFTLETMQNGRKSTGDFSTTKYLRK